MSAAIAAHAQLRVRPIDLEPFEHNVGWKKGALVTANVGQCRWMFVGLGLWRQVAAGTDGAFQLLANLASRGKFPRK